MGLFQQNWEIFKGKIGTFCRKIKTLKKLELFEKPFTFWRQIGTLWRKIEILKKNLGISITKFCLWKKNAYKKQATFSVKNMGLDREKRTFRRKMRISIKNREFLKQKSDFLKKN